MSIEKYEKYIFNYRFKDKIIGYQHPHGDSIVQKRKLEEIDAISSNASLGIVIPSNLDLRTWSANLDQEDFPCGSVSTVSCAVSLLHKLCDVDRYLVTKIFLMNKKPQWVISRLHNYWNSRILEQSNGSVLDSVMLESSLLVLQGRKICDETLWPYDKNYINIQPDLNVDISTGTYRYTIKYNILSNSINLIKSELYHHHPVILGIVLYDNWNSSSIGLIPLPDLYENKVLGTHTITLVGYNNEKKYFIFQNTLGKSWGDKGFGYIEYEYILNQDICGDIYSLYI